MFPQRLIKKYPNRRLYDTVGSQYITLNDLRRLILEGTDIRVVDSQTEADITRSVLLQIITEAEAAGEPLFSTSLLTQMIRFYGGNMQGLFAQYLEQSIRLFAEQQPSGTASPVEAMTRLTENNLRLWGQFQQEWLNYLGEKKS